MTPVRVSAPTEDEQVLQSCQNLNFTLLLLDKAMGTEAGVVCVLTEQQFHLSTGLSCLLPCFSFFKFWTKPLTLWKYKFPQPSQIGWNCNFPYSLLWSINWAGIRHNSSRTMSNSSGFSVHSSTLLSYNYPFYFHQDLHACISFHLPKG